MQLAKKEAKKLQRKVAGKIFFVGEPEMIATCFITKNRRKKKSKNFRKKKTKKKKREKREKREKTKKQ